MKTNIITVGRQPGSGGRLIAARLSEMLGYQVYDKELLNMASRESGVNKEFFEKMDEKVSHSTFGGLFGLRGVSGEDYYSGYYLSNETLFQIQSDVIRRIAEEKSAIFLGRCADYVLKDHPSILSIFVSADLPDRIQRVAKYMDYSEHKAKEWIAKMDKKRKSYYDYFSNKSWGDASSYHLCLNTSVLGIESSAKLIFSFAQELFANKY